MDDLETLLENTMPLDEEAEVVEDVGLSDEEIRALCEEEYRNAKPPSEVMAAWKLALQQYFLEPDGNEEEGESQVQSSDVRDGIEAAMPIIMDMFMSSESPVVFKPNHEKDIDQAELETAFCNYVLNTQNDGALIMMQWFKEALLLKNGYVKVFWDALVNEEREDYQGLDADQLAAVMADDDYEVMGITEIPPMDPEGMMLWDVQGKRRSDAGQVRIVNLPTDRVRVSSTWNSIVLDGCPYVCHEEKCIRSDLVVDGFDPEIVAELPTENVDIDDDSSLDRYRRDDANNPSTTTSSDPSRDVLTRYEHYIRADRNGDGITELLKVTIIGAEGGTVLDIEEVDGHSIIPTTAYIVPNRVLGMSLHEFLSETQKVQTSLLRQTLNNVYLSNQPGTAFNVTNISNVEALSQPRIGRIILKKSAEAVSETIAVPFMAEKSLAVMSAMDERAEKKTGLSAESTGLDAESLAKSTNFVGGMAMNLSQLRMKLVMTTLVLTGFKPLVYRIRELVMKNMSRQEMIELGGKWVPIDPRNWREKRNTQIRIGVGTVQKAERMMALQQIIGLQREIVASQGGVSGPFVTERNIYNTLRDVERLTGTLSVDRYFSDPANYTPPAPPPNIASEALQIEEAKVVEKAAKDAADVQLKNRELDIKQAELGIKAQQAAQAQIQAATDRIMQVSENVAA